MTDETQDPTSIAEIRVELDELLTHPNPYQTALESQVYLLDSCCMR